ncbi:hypothetical protein PRZ48_008873 [Zasmidium cellare]|uniref:Uncharacterized protein n=1 Tax=Zasmidium cellare TaxID=395010 RepID=A0ABR0EH43_ZASCE|nr:hypothetical protein PRZ48_008873 [Zasmidium cellare]
MAPAGEKTLTIYVNDGIKIHNVGRVHKRKAMYMSPAIRDQIFAGGCKEMMDRQGAIFSTPDVDITSAQVIMRWIDRYNTFAPAKGQGITQDHVGSEEFTKVMQVYRAAREMGLSKTIRGNAIRDDMLHYIRMAPLTLNEFIMIHESTPFDEYILSTAMNCSINFSMGLNKPPEMQQIEQYCEWAGIGQKFADVRKHIIDKRREAREAKAKAAQQGN